MPLPPSVGVWTATFWSILIASTLFILFHDRGFDDPYVTYRYAYNLAHGHGFVYNPGEHVLSTTTPLYALLLATIEMMGLPIPLASNAIGSVSLALGGLAFWQLGRLQRTPAGGAAGLLLYPTFPFLIGTLGAETTFYITLILIGMVAYARGRYAAAAVLLAGATLARADAVVAAGVLALHFLLVRREPLPWRALAVYAGLLLPWFAFAWWYFGAPLPVTLAAKQQQARMAISQTFFEGFGGVVAGYWEKPAYRLHFALGALGVVVAVWRRYRTWLLLPVWAGAYFAAYTMLGVSRYFWYYASLVAGAVALIGLGVEGVGRGVARVLGRRMAVGITVVLLIALSIPQARSLWRGRHWKDPRLEIYQEVGEWLRAHTPADASVGTLEVGIIGYYAQRPMIGFAGLLQPETARRLTSTGTYEESARWATEHFRPDYLVLQDGIFPRLEQTLSTRAACQIIHIIEDEVYSSPIAIYRCRWEKTMSKAFDSKRLRHRGKRR